MTHRGEVIRLTMATVLAVALLPAGAAADDLGRRRVFVAGLAGGLYVVWSRLRRPLPTWAMLLGVAPVIIDVAISTADIRPSTPSSRLWTGALSAFVLVWWAYPRFEAQLRDVQRHVARLTSHAANVE